MFIKINVSLQYSQLFDLLVIKEKLSTKMILPHMFNCIYLNSYFIDILFGGETIHIILCKPFPKRYLTLVYYRGVLQYV